MTVRRVQMSPATASGDPKCTPCLKNSNSEVAATTSELLHMARRLLYSYYILYIVRMIKSVRTEMDRMCSTH
jgi:hypothetical protein